MTKWVFINLSKGTTANGSPVTDAELAIIASACQIQMNRDYASECGAVPTTCRVGKDITDIQPDEQVYSFVDTFADIPDASAYHDVTGKGVPASHCAISTCEDVFGLDGCSMDASHEILEAERNPGCNKAVDDNNGTMHEDEACDPCETQGYVIKIGDQDVYVSNFTLPSWGIPNHPGPYTFMVKHKHKYPGGEDPPGPFQTVPTKSGNGNYQIEFPSSASAANQVFGKGRSLTPVIKGNPKKLQKVTHPQSRTQRIMRNHMVRMNPGK